MIYFELKHTFHMPAEEIGELTVDQVNWLMSELSKRRKDEGNAIKSAAGKPFGLFPVVVLNRY